MGFTGGLQKDHEKKNASKTPLGFATRATGRLQWPPFEMGMAVEERENQGRQEFV